MTGLLTLLPVSLVEHERARQAEFGIFELFKESGFLSCLALVASRVTTKFSVSLAISGFTVTLGATVGPVTGGVLVKMRVSVFAAFWKEIVSPSMSAVLRVAQFRR